MFIYIYYFPFFLFLIFYYKQGRVPLQTGKAVLFYRKKESCKRTLYNDLLYFFSLRIAVERYTVV